ncbi:M28 family peptidase [Sphingopyxis sp.]|jgi:hypothetical protein|uniref:M28 family peptidase n=1 Tax=Sphingopyxis sp. TaxID=1908224 RepID=UPI002DE56198|nr:M28 family peptidase [Sphingopyxis sp.]
MNKRHFGPIGYGLSAILGLAMSIALPVQAQDGETQPRERTNLDPRAKRILEVMAPGKEAFRLEDSMLRWPLPPGEERYGRIDGQKLKPYVDELAQLSRDYRDEGNQYWGRIMGTSVDLIGAEWLASHYRRLGLSNVRLQPFDVPTTIMPKQWSVDIAGSGTRTSLASALPIARFSADPIKASAEAVYVGLGEAADFMGRDVKGKAVFIYAIPEPSSFFTSAALNGAVTRAENAGASAVFIIFGLPGNITGHLLIETQKIPAFVIGKEDGDRVRERIESGKTSIDYSLVTETRSDLKTYQVWGELPGESDETIYVLAHRDGYFEAGLDNASGVATMLGLAEYYAAVPQKDRRRKMIFVGTPGHHDPNYLGTAWMHDNREQVFAKTALLINAEHTAYVEASDFLGKLRPSNAIPPYNWYVGGSKKMVDISWMAFREFGVPLLAQPDGHAPGEVGKIWRDAPMVQIISGAWPYHSSADTADIIPATGLEASTRAYAKIIDEVNKHDLADLRSDPRP